MHQHIARLKAHRNVLYGIVVVLLIFQIISFVTISSQASVIKAEQAYLKSLIDDARQENQVGIDEIVKIINQQNVDFNEKIELLKTSEQDFSGVISEVIKGVVSVRTDKSIGTGFIISPDGYVVTNYHVIRDSKIIRTTTFDNKNHEAFFIGGDELTDLAILKMDGNFDYLNFADSDAIQIGEKVIAIGNPLGLSFTVTEGIVSAVKRQGPNGLEGYVQTDVTLNPGNSGGPLINRRGEVIGINNFKIGGAESLGFALESNKAKEVINLIGKGILAN